jgi:hypothetical protein
MEPEGHAMISLYHVETLEWIEPRHQLPDADTTVLVFAREADDPVWLGYWDGKSWFTVNGVEYSNADEIAASVTAWATLPTGGAT